MTDLEYLIRDKYNGDSSLVTEEDKRRLASSEPLACVIGWIPFLGLKVYLDSHPLIPRPETEWWTEMMLESIHLRCCGTHSKLHRTPCTAQSFARPRLASEHFQTPSESIHVLDLCAGSGAIGLSVLREIPTAQVCFIEKEHPHLATIQKNIAVNNLDPLRASLFSGDLFENVPETQFDIIACNPPYIPSTRILEKSVTEFEPAEALYGGDDGLDLIRRIAQEAPAHLKAHGELWLEADIENIDEAKGLLLSHGARDAVIQDDLYGRPRLVIAYY